MTLDTTINLPTLVTLALAIIAAIVWLVRLEGRVTANAAAIADLNRIDEDDAKKFGAVEALMALTREQLQSYKTEVAERYVTREVIGEIKREIIAEIKATEARVEGQINRLVESRP